MSQVAEAVRAPAPGEDQGQALALPGVYAGVLRLLVMGRWFVLLTVLVTLPLRYRFPVDQPAMLAVCVAAAAYNAAQWALLRAGRFGRVPPALLLSMDLAIITLLDWFSGGVRSPFIDLYYLVVVAAAAFYELRGSLATAAAAAGLQFVMVLLRSGDRIDRLDFAIGSTPYLFLAAAAAGYLVRRLREEWERRRQAETELARLAREQSAMQRELEVAREVQSTFVRAPAPRLPGLAIATYTQPLHGIGGDLQDYVPLADGVAVAVADVSGHSLSAAILAARLVHLLEDVGLGTPMGEVLHSWNRTILDRTPPEVFVTAVLCEIRYCDGHVCYAIAGHPSPLLWRRATGEVAPLVGEGVALGLLEGASWQVREICLQPGDVLLLYTDGAVEARNADGVPLETEGLASLLARHAVLPPDEAVERLAAEIHGSHEVRDDLTLVLVARTE